MRICRIYGIALAETIRKSVKIKKMRNSPKLVTKLLKMSEKDATALERLALLAQKHYQQRCPHALAAELPSISHVMRALIRYAEEVTAINPATGSGAEVVERCAFGGGRWD